MTPVTSTSLVVVCPKCDGEGFIWYGEAERQHCDYCYGFGYLPVMTKAEFDKLYQERHSG